MGRPDVRRPPGPEPAEEGSHGLPCLSGVREMVKESDLGREAGRIEIGEVRARGSEARGVNSKGGVEGDAESTCEESSSVLGSRIGVRSGVGGK